jgi:hypothetical protein
MASHKEKAFCVFSFEVSRSLWLQYSVSFVHGLKKTLFLCGACVFVCVYIHIHTHTHTSKPITVATRV